MKITESAEIAKMNMKFLPSAYGAYATGRVLDGQHMQANNQEWAERGKIEGKGATVYYIFENAEADAEDGADMPFDADHIDRIEIEDD
jgi:hypothetical protein